MKSPRSKIVCYEIDNTFLRYPFFQDQLKCPLCTQHPTSRSTILDMEKTARFADFLDLERNKAFDNEHDHVIPMEREMTVLTCNSADCGWWAIRMYIIYTTLHWQDVASDYLVTQPISNKSQKKEEYDDTSWISWQTFFQNDKNWIMSKSKLSRDQSVLLFGINEVYSKSCFDNPNKPKTVDYWRCHRNFSKQAIFHG